MLFALGYVAGLLTATLIVATLAFFRRVIEYKTTIIEKQIDKVGPKPQGFIVEPETDAKEARNRIIERNAAQGRDTRISELE